MPLTKNDGEAVQQCADKFRMKKSVWTALAVVCVGPWCQLLSAQPPAKSVCPRPQAGSTVEEPEDLHSQNGVLEAQLTANDAADASGAIRYCYTDAAGRESPNLRVNPGDLVVLHLKNALTDLSPDRTGAAHAHLHSWMTNNPCTSGQS